MSRHKKSEETSKNDGRKYNKRFYDGDCNVPEVMCRETGNIELNSNLMLLARRV